MIRSSDLPTLFIVLAEVTQDQLVVFHLLLILIGTPRIIVGPPLITADPTELLVVPLAATLIVVGHGAVIRLVLPHFLLICILLKLTGAILGQRARCGILRLLRGLPSLGVLRWLIICLLSVVHFSKFKII